MQGLCAAWPGHAIYRPLPFALHPLHNYQAGMGLQAWRADLITPSQTREPLHEGHIKRWARRDRKGGSSGREHLHTAATLAMGIDHVRPMVCACTTACARHPIMEFQSGQNCVSKKSWHHSQNAWHRLQNAWHDWHKIHGM